MTWDLTIEQKDKFLELMHDMGAHSMFYLNDMTKRLSECGIPVTEDSENALKEAISILKPSVFLFTKTR
jgi:hypothetical protein